MADVYVEALAGDAERRPQELHRFLVHCPDGRRLESVAEKRCAAPRLCCGLRKHAAFPAAPVYLICMPDMLFRRMACASPQP